MTTQPTQPIQPIVPTLFLFIENHGETFTLSAETPPRGTKCVLRLVARRDCPSLYSIRSWPLTDPRKFADNLWRLPSESTTVDSSVHLALRQANLLPANPPGAILTFVVERCCVFCIESRDGRGAPTVLGAATVNSPRAEFLRTGDTIVRLAPIDAILDRAARGSVPSTEAFVSSLGGFSARGEAGLPLRNVRRQIRDLLFHRDRIGYPNERYAAHRRKLLEYAPAFSIDMYTLEDGACAFAIENAAGPVRDFGPEFKLWPAPDPIACPFRGKVTWRGTIGELYPPQVGCEAGVVHLPHVATHPTFTENDATPADLVDKLTAVLPAKARPEEFAWFAKLRRGSLRREPGAKGWRLADNDPLDSDPNDFLLRSVLFEVKEIESSRRGVVYATTGSRAEAALDLGVCAEHPSGLIEWTEGGGAYCSLPVSLVIVSGSIWCPRHKSMA
jgi:hypothetical protein